MFLVSHRKGEADKVLVKEPFELEAAIKVAFMCTLLVLIIAKMNSNVTSIY